MNETMSLNYQNRKLLLLNKEMKVYMHNGSTLLVHGHSTLVNTHHILAFWFLDRHTLSVAHDLIS